MQKSLKPLYPYLWKYRYTLLFGALTVVLTNGIWVLFPQVVQRASDALNRGTTRRQLMIYCLLMVAIALFGWPARYASMNAFHACAGRSRPYSGRPLAATIACVESPLPTQTAALTCGV